MQNNDKQARISEKLRRKQAVEQYKNNQRSEFILSLPMKKDLFVALFDFLDEKLSKQDCDHTLSVTIEFLKNNNQDVNSVIEWLYRNGGDCDCEVLCNIEDLFDEYS